MQITQQSIKTLMKKALQDAEHNSTKFDAFLANTTFNRSIAI